MTWFLLAYLAGVLTIATPCIFPILPFVLARANEPFRRGSLPMLFGLSFAFAAAASLASVTGGWAVQANHAGRTAALALITLFGLTMLLPTLAVRVTAPVVAVGARLSSLAEQRMSGGRTTVVFSMLLGVATGLVWAPCAGPVLGLILTTAALRGPSFETSLLLFVYGLGAATSLAAGLFFGGSVLAFIKRLAGWGDNLRRVVGAAVVVGAAIIWLGLDTGLFTRWSSATTNTLEQHLITAFGGSPGAQNQRTENARALSPALSTPLASLLETSQWLNTKPLRAEDLRGKVVLVNFWTFSCINCLRALPYVRAWAETYKDRGLVVIGVHTPEFAFEKNVASVEKASASLGVGYPVAVDNEFRIWRTFGNYAWPALFLIDADGRVRRSAFGEGGYEQFERLIQQLLSEANDSTVTNDIAGVTGTGLQAAADIRNLRSGEAYIGYRKAGNFASPGGIKKDAPNLYRAASMLSLNQWSLAGNWKVGGEFAALNDPSGSITYRFHSRDLHLVMAPSSQGQPVRFRIKIDGAAPGADHGVDVDSEGRGSVQESRLYQLVRQAGAVTDHTFEIEFLDAGVRAYAFTFG